MDAIEKSFRDQPGNFVKLKRFVEFLIENKRIIEASFFCDILLKRAPRDVKTNKLAYSLAIKRMDRDVQRYDKILWDKNAKEEEILTLQAKYYYAFHDRKHLLDCIGTIMDGKITSTDTMDILIDSLIYVNDYPPTKQFLSHHGKSGQMTPHLENIFRNILITKLCEILTRIVEVSHG